MIKNHLDSKTSSDRGQQQVAQSTPNESSEDTKLEGGQILELRKEVLAKKKEEQRKSIIEKSGSKIERSHSQERLDDINEAGLVAVSLNAEDRLPNVELDPLNIDDIKRFCSPQINPITRHFSEITGLEMNEKDDMFDILPISQGRPLVIGLCGGNCSGKADLVNYLVNRLGKKNCTIMRQENFFKNVSEEERKSFNFDDPEATDWNLMMEALNALLINNKPFHSPIYDFNLSRRDLKSEELWPNSIIIVEGLLIFHLEAIRERLHLKIFLDTDDDIRLSKRILKDCIQLKRPLDQVIERYKKFVKPCHEQYVLPSKKYADIIIPNYGSSVCEHIEQMNWIETTAGKKNKTGINKPNVALELMIQQIKNELEIQQEVRQFRKSKKKFGI